MRRRLLTWLKTKLLSIPDRRPPDFIVGGAENPYLCRWHVIPRNRFCNIYLHHFLRSDDDRALHDHPWVSFSWLLKGRYTEITNLRLPLSNNRQLFVLTGPLNDINLSVNYREGDRIYRLSGKSAHRIVINPGETCWTLFITGPRYREWGFYCPQGWIPWYKFTDPADKGGIGKGCDQ